MFKVKYLLLLDDENAKCKTVKALKSLFESNSDITVDKDQITYKNYTAQLLVTLGKKDSTSHLFFNVSLQCDAKKDIEKFSELLKAVRSSISLISKNNYVIWDDLSLYYAHKAYPIVFEIENLMRQLIMKFMLTNIGVGWTKDRVPTEVQQSINPNNKDINYLNNVDFIQLKNFLFSENYPVHKESLIQKLKNANDLSSLNLDEIKTLLPDSNWSKYFEPLVGCEAEYLKNRWDKLYDLRCSIAHNKTFRKADLDQVNLLASELKPNLEKALNSLDDIVIDETERENLAENAVINLNEVYGRFIIKFRQFEVLLREIISKLSNGEIRKAGLLGQSDLLVKNGIISRDQRQKMTTLIFVRNDIMHSDPRLTYHDINHFLMIMDEFIVIFQSYINNSSSKT